MPDFYNFYDNLDAPYRNKFESLNKEDKEQIVGKFFLGTQHISILENIIRNYKPKENIITETSIVQHYEDEKTDEEETHYVPKWMRKTYNAVMNGIKINNTPQMRQIDKQFLDAEHEHKYKMAKLKHDYKNERLKMIPDKEKREYAERDDDGRIITLIRDVINKPVKNKRIRSPDQGILPDPY